MSVAAVVCRAVVLLGLGSAIALADPGVPGGRASGMVKDQSGAAVQNAAVEATSLESSLVRSALTNDEGRYVLEGLPAGRYRISAARRGFETASRDVAVVAGQDVVAELVIAVAVRKEAVVVTAPTTSRPLVVETDPRVARLPIPAHDGADYLKMIPGFSIVRKGGTDGDPVLRGMAGSRVGILLDGQQLLGGCGGRMDPPTAYVFPAAYDRITVLKGPQSVLYGAESSAGTVLFERDVRRPERAELQLDGALTLSRFGRHDELLDVRGATPAGYAQAVVTRSHTGDYQDGSGTAVHSLYTRWSGNAALGWTPREGTRLEASVVKSDGEAAYADRSMDGPRIAREGAALRFESRHVVSWLDAIEARAYYNYIDHVMDNYSLRTPGKTFSAMNPDRRTSGGRLAVTVAPAASTRVVLGGDLRDDVHRARGAMAQSSAELATDAYLATPRLEDMRFSQLGAFAEATQTLPGPSRLIAGFRADWNEAVDSRECVGASMCPGASPARNDTRGATDRKTLRSGFGRYELDIRGGGTLYAGVGHAERFPDYWERLKADADGQGSAFLAVRPERTTQLDLGMLWRSSAFSASLSGFYGKLNDYILIHWQPAPSLVRNVDATTMGFEAELSRSFEWGLTAHATGAYVRSQNDTDGKPLAQQPPLEARIGLDYARRALSLGALARFVASQDRVDVGSGNIVSNGMDLGRTGGFSVFSIYGGYRFKGGLLITAGVDNLLDRTYAEHLSRAGAMVPDFVQMARINEPGRTFWLRTSYRFN